MNLYKGLIAGRVKAGVATKKEREWYAKNDFRGSKYLKKGDQGYKKRGQP